MARMRKKMETAPFFDSEFVVTRVSTATCGRAIAQSPAYPNGIPVRTAEPTCVFCGRTGDAIESAPFMHAIPASIWRPLDRDAHGSKFPSAAQEVFLSDLREPESYARAHQLCVPMWRCKEEVIKSLVKVQSRDGGEPERMFVFHKHLGACPCGALDSEGYDLYPQDSKISDFAGGRYIFPKDEMLVFNDINPEVDEGLVMHAYCATRQCAACGSLRAKNDIDPDDTAWAEVGDLLDDTGMLVMFCDNCDVHDEECLGAQDLRRGGAKVESCYEEISFFTRDPGSGEKPRRCTTYCAVHKPKLKKSRKAPGKEPAGKRAAAEEQ